MVSKKKMHRMPNGEMMEGPKHEKTESAKERTREYGPKAAKVKKVMHEWKQGTLHSGKDGKIVRSQKQAVAIAISQSNKATRGGVRKRKSAIEGK